MDEIISIYTEKIEEQLYRCFNNPLDSYKLLFDSMQYSLKNGGKRVRPLLTLLFCKASGGEPEKALPFAAAVEYIHTYSLIHDDLPCMDNDDFRRGKPSNHKAFGEANALLAGDGLLTAAFESIASGAVEGLYSYETATRASLCLSVLAGARGMVGGQVIDLQSEGKSVGIETLTQMDNLKTGALIEAACTLGCIAADASDEQISAAKKFARNIGLAFQIQDDILDVTGTTENLGKKTGSDLANKKSTYVGLLGLENSGKLVKELTADALKALDAFDNNAALREYALFLANREN